MKSTAISCVLLSLCCMIYAQQESCTAVNGEQGQCVPINECQSLLAIINNKERTGHETELLKKSHCGFQGNMPTVCCPKTKSSSPTIKCYTPEGNPGECISLNSCDNLKNLLSPPADNTKIQYVERSRCIGPEQYSVCCGPVPDLKSIQKGGCSQKLSAFPPDPATECCGFDSRFDDRIVGGNKTTVDQYPWLVIVEYEKDGIMKTLCGGALISSKYVLTAGHCVLGSILKSGTPKNIRLAEYDTSNDGPDCAPTAAGGMDCTEGVLRIPIEKTIPHPEYNPPQKKHDIALIRMAGNAPFTDFIRPICLPRIDVTTRPTPFNLTVAGWGAVSWNVRSSAVKLQVEVPYVNLADCQPAYQAPGRTVTLWEGQICAGGEEGKDSCKGDSGGPLMYENARIHEAVGIVSFGPTPCGLDNVPGIYTNVYQYNPWIRSNIVP